MLQIVTIFGGVVYAYLGMVLLTNCSIELAQQKRRPGLWTVALSIVWPVTILIVALSIATAPLRHQK